MRNKKIHTPYYRTVHYLSSIGYDQKTANEIMKEFAGESFTDHKSAGELVQKDFGAFLKFYGTVKNKYCKLRIKQEEIYNEYNDIQEALRYTNGSADYF